MTRLNFSGNVEIGTLVETDGYLLCRHFCKLALQTKAMVLIAGVFGVGKSVAVQDALREMDADGAPGRLRYIRLAANPTRLSTARQLHESLTGRDSDHTSFDIARAIKRETSVGVPSLIVVDEIEGLSYPDQRFLQELRDDPRENFGLVLVAGEVAYDKIRTWRGLMDRVLTTQMYGPLTTEEAERLIPQFHRLYRDASTARLALLLDGSEGKLRILAKITFHLEAILKERGASEATDGLIEEAIFRTAERRLERGRPKGRKV